MSTRKKHSLHSVLLPVWVHFTTWPGRSLDNSKSSRLIFLRIGVDESALTQQGTKNRTRRNTEPYIRDMSGNTLLLAKIDHDVTCARYVSATMVAPTSRKRRSPLSGRGRDTDGSTQTHSAGIPTCRTFRPGRRRCCAGASCTRTTPTPGGRPTAIKTINNITTQIS